MKKLGAESCSDLKASRVSMPFRSFLVPLAPFCTAGELGAAPPAEVSWCAPDGMFGGPAATPTPCCCGPAASGELGGGPAEPVVAPMGSAPAGEHAGNSFTIDR